MSYYCCKYYPLYMITVIHTSLSWLFCTQLQVNNASNLMLLNINPTGSLGFFLNREVYFSEGVMISLILRSVNRCITLIKRKFSALVKVIKLKKCLCQTVVYSFTINLYEVHRHLHSLSCIDTFWKYVVIICIFECTTVVRMYLTNKIIPFWGK